MLLLSIVRCVQVDLRAHGARGTIYLWQGIVSSGTCGSISVSSQVLLVLLLSIVCCVQVDLRVNGKYGSLAVSSQRLLALLLVGLLHCAWIPVLLGHFLTF